MYHFIIVESTISWTSVCCQLRYCCFSVVVSYLPRTKIVINVCFFQETTAYDRIRTWVHSVSRITPKTPLRIHLPSIRISRWCASITAIRLLMVTLINRYQCTMKDLVYLILVVSHMTARMSCDQTAKLHSFCLPVKY